MRYAIDYREYPVLFVDDESDLVETLRLNYERDFTVLGATSGEEALAVVSGEPVAVLVTDQRMPGMSGLEVIARAREVRPALVPIILTGYTEVEALVDAVNRGDIHRYIFKPWDSRELRIALCIAIEKSYLVQENARLSRENQQLVAELRRTREG
jgi:DNA-binding NtrC family response regulator